MMERSNQVPVGKRGTSQLADVDGGLLGNHGSSIFRRVERGLLKSPHQPAVICMHQSQDHFEKCKGFDIDSDADRIRVIRRGDETDCLTLTYTQLHAEGLKLAKGLIGLGIQPGANLLCMVENGGEYALLLWAGVIARLTHSPVDPAMLEPGKRNELETHLEVLKPTAVVVPSTSHIDAIECASKHSGVRIELGIFLEEDKEIPRRSHWKSLGEVLDRGAASKTSDNNDLLEIARRDDPGRISSIMFTSGTSAGRPKGCPSTVASQTHALESQAWLINKDNSARVLQQAHNSRAIGLLHALLTWQAGGALVLPTGSSFSLDHTVDAILHHQVTFVALSPALVHTIGSEFLSREAKMGDWDHVRTIQIGGDAVTREVLGKCAALFPKAEVVVNHGMSEGSGSFTWPFHDKPVTRIPFFAGSISPIGVVARGARIMIWDSNTCAAARRGRPGEMLVCSPSLIRGYVGGEENDNEVFCQDRQGRRWMKTGDVALMDQDGLVYILGRSKHAINRGGFAIMPAVVESCIEKFTGAQASVVAVRSPMHGYEPFAVVRSLKGVTAEEIIQHVKRCLGNEYTLSGVASLAQVGLKEFPVNATHKIIKADVEKAHLRKIEYPS
ncbi:acetyl-CoA synthetase-like protein [Diaporthe eres]|nr:acetyl-CoA synthetase-like protein [Diaporthe eres]